MKISEVKKLKKGTPIKVVYRKFPYIGKFYDFDTLEVYPGDTVFAEVQFADERIPVNIKWMCAIEGITKFNKT